MATFISHSPAETEALGESWGRAAEPGLVLGLSGELGAGKTQLVKGLARGLEIGQRVHSPTFTLVNVYTGGRLPLFHLDLYRLETIEQIRAAGLEEYLQTEGVTVIEWFEKAEGMRRQRAEGRRQKAEGKPEEQAPIQSVRPGIRVVQIEIVGESERRITYEDTGA